MTKATRLQPSDLRGLARLATSAITGVADLVEAMHEIYAPDDSADHPFYEIVTHEWASRWPAEELWVARLG